MSEAASLHNRSRSPTAADHVALRALIKYMSSVLGIPYKIICAETNISEHDVKNYTNDKTYKSEASKSSFHELANGCADILQKRGLSDIDRFVIDILLHLFGNHWLVSAGGGYEQAPDDIFLNWLRVSPEELDRVEAQYRGLWRIFRAWTPVTMASEAWTPAKMVEFDYSILDIRPRRSIEKTELCSFRWYYSGKHYEPGEYGSIEGLVIPNNDRIEFLGHGTSWQKSLSLMVWRYPANPEIRPHAEVSNGISLSFGSTGNPVATRVRAVFIEKSNKLTNSDFEALRRDELSQIGVRSMESLRLILPEDQLDRTLQFISDTKPIYGFFPENHREYS
jgi:hypothetical protein